MLEEKGKATGGLVIGHMIYYPYVHLMTVASHKKLLHNNPLPPGQQTHILLWLHNTVNLLEKKDTAYGLAYYYMHLLFTPKRVTLQRDTQIKT